jgi:hypothetical protein
MAVTARAAVVASILLAWFGAPAAAQPTQPPPLDRIVRGGPVALSSGMGTFGSLYRVLRSVGVPIGFEKVDALLEYTVTPSRLRVKEVKVSGLTLRAALDRVVAADPRYSWEYMNGVVVMRPVVAWSDPDHPLHRLVPSVHLERVSGGQAVDALKEATGHPGEPVSAFPRTRPLTVRFDGGRLIDLLNVIVRAHGEMAWSLDGSMSSPDREQWTFRPHLFLYSPTGSGMVVDGALLEPAAAIPPGIFIRGIPSPEPEAVPARERLDLPLPASVTQLHAKGVTHLAMSLGVASGFEEAGAFEEFVSQPFHLPERGISSEPPREFTVPVSGLTLRQALDAYVGADRRYEWREMDGVIVMRPVASWRSPDHRLQAAAGAVRLRDAPLWELFDALRGAVVSERHPPASPFGDERRISVDFPGGSVLQFVNALVRAHGRLSWSLKSGEYLAPLEPGKAVWVIEPELTLMSPSGGMAIPLGR